MYKLVVKHGEVERELEFATAELAQLYRDYHLAFGHWNGKAEWKEEKDVKEESKPFIIDEMTEFVDGNLVRKYRLTDGIKFVIEEVTGTTVAEVWKIFRKQRNRMLAYTDWTQLSDAEISTELRKDYRAYRNYLRVLPSLYNDDTIVKAKVYSFEDWKKGMR